MPRHRFAVLAGLVAALAAPLSAQARRTENVVLVVIDGVRWQEVFAGAESVLVSREAGGVTDTAALGREVWAATPEARRRLLFPFLWDSVAARGQLFGDRGAGNDARMANPLRFSYPGYHEILAGHVDPAIAANDFGPNPNRTVFEWLARRPAAAGRVAAFGTWDVFADIFNRRRARFPVHAAFDPPLLPPHDGATRMLDRLYRTTARQWDGTLSLDGFMQAQVLDYVRKARPRLLFVGFGEPDQWAHEGRYDLYLRAARQADAFVAELWGAMQAMPQYRGRTTVIVTTDHGRGSGTREWRSHGRTVDGAERTWIAVLGPDTPARGVRGADAGVTAAQLAATVAAFLGEDWAAEEPRAARPIPGLLPGGR